MGDKEKNEYGFNPRFIPKSTKGEKRKRNVRFWANLNQVSNCEELYQEIVEQEEKKTVTEKGQKEKKKAEKKSKGRAISNEKKNDENMDRSPEAKRKRGEDNEDIGNEKEGGKENVENEENNENKENENKEKEDEEDDYSWYEEDINTWDECLMAAKENGIFKKCIDCKKMYCAEYDNKAKIKCLVCNLNIHGCIKEKSCQLSEGYVWLCIECKETIENKDTDLIEKIREEMVKKITIGKNTEKRTYEHKKDGEKSNYQNDKEKTSVTETIKEKDPADCNILEYHGTNIRQSDLMSLEGENWINDSIISFWLEHLQRVTFCQNTQLLFVSPATTQLIKIGDKKDIPNILNHLGAWHMEYIFFSCK
ncbi:unnamed protein product [Meganyctiphanes norvegica]|uniref:PHD-type domain-containing protein n=1 Tax=Meganyctiphanes norvegica TaxID=48144 RepID=A0AAV2PQ42_MEGNR